MKLRESRSSARPWKARTTRATCAPAASTASLAPCTLTLHACIQVRHGTLRTQTVEGPSQIRYCHYLEATLYHCVNPVAEVAMILTSVCFPAGNVYLCNMYVYIHVYLHTYAHKVYVYDVRVFPC